MNTLARLATAKYRRALDFDDHSAAAAGTDLYERPLTTMNTAKCDYHCRTVFRLPINEQRRRRKSWRFRFGEGLVSYDGHHITA